MVASRTFGVTMADFGRRSLGIGYVGDPSILLTVLMSPARAVARVRGCGLSRHCQQCTDKGFLLDGHHALANAPRLGTVSPRLADLILRAVHPFLQRQSPLLPRSFTWRLHPACCCSGRPTFSLGLWVPQWTFFFTISQSWRSRPEPAFRFGVIAGLSLFLSLCYRSEPAVTGGSCRPPPHDMLRLRHDVTLLRNCPCCDRAHSRAIPYQRPRPRRGPPEAIRLLHQIAQ